MINPFIYYQIKVKLLFKKYLNLMTHVKINKLIIMLIMLFICLNLTREHWHNFSNDVSAGMNNPTQSIKKVSTYYDHFYTYLSHEINVYKNKKGKWSREVDLNEIQLEQREKTRWIFNTFIIKAFISVKNISDSQNFYPKEKAALYLYSIFIGLFLYSTYIFLYLKINLLTSLNTNQKEENYYSVTSYIFFSYFLAIAYLNFVHYRGGEDNFSIFETFCISAAIYFVAVDKKWSFIAFIIVCMIAPLVRESGIFISIYYSMYHFFFFKKFKAHGLLIPFISLVPYVISNYDLFNFYLQDGFIYTVKEIESQTTVFNFRNNLIGTFNALFYNIIIFFVPVLLFFKKNNKLILFLLCIIMFYFILLIFGAVLDHVSTRFMPTIFIIIYVYVGMNNIDLQFNNKN